ncbi:MAG: response regulator [Pseudomonadota bacterium]
MDLERLTVLLAEDSPFIRSLLTNSLKVLGVGTVIAVEDGGAAIEFIQKVHKDPVKAGVMAIDIVITNWEMSPVNGMMLLRWIRRHKDSPDRFLPVMMITAYTEKARVTEARDLGVHEMLAKPFTIKALSEKLMLVIMRNRQFVHTKDYFGPDRRRQVLQFHGPEKRKLTDKSPEVEVVVRG